MTDFIDPKECSDMPALRDAIDALDQSIVDLLVTRASYIDRAIELKRLNGWPARLPDRIEEVVGKVKSKAKQNDLDDELVERLWRHLIEWSIAREETAFAMDEQKD